jgi:hypothetical protein
MEQVELATSAGDLQVELATSAGDSHSGSADTHIQTAQATANEANEEGGMCGPL